jgi:hypothetical protein
MLLEQDSDAGRPQPLALNPGDPSLQLRPHCMIAVGMGSHNRLGADSLLQQLSADVLGRIAKHLESGIPFQEYIYRDLHAKCPRLIPGFATFQGAACQDSGPCVGRIYSFIRFLHQSVESAERPPDSGRIPLLDWDQLQSVVPGGKEVTEEVADLLLKWMAGLLGVDIMFKGVIVPRNQGLAGLAVPKQCLVLDTLAFDELVDAFCGECAPPFHGEWDRHRVHAYECRVDEIARATAEAFAQYARDLNVLLRPYDSTLWSMCHRSVSTWKVVRPTACDYSFNALSVTKTQREGRTLVSGQVWDPARKHALGISESCAVQALFKEQSDLFGVEDQPSHQRIDGHGTGSLFHSMLNIAMVCTGMSLPADDEECAIYAAALQGHCYLSMVRDWVDQGLDLDIDAAFREWLAHNPETPPSELTPLPPFANDAGGSPASSTSNGADQPGLAQLAAAANVAAAAANVTAAAADGTRVAANGAANPRCVDLSLYRITVVLPEFRMAIENLQKFVEFRSGNQTEVFFEGMKLLFSGTADDRRIGNTDLVCAEVAEVCRLSCEAAYARFSVEAVACNLERMCSRWGCSTVICYVLQPDTIRKATELVNLAEGNQGILKQITGTTGSPRFCHVSDLGKCMLVQLRTGVTARCTFRRAWPVPDMSQPMTPPLSPRSGESNDPSRHQHFQDDLSSLAAASWRDEARSLPKDGQVKCTACIPLSFFVITLPQRLSPPAVSECII